VRHGRSTGGHDHVHVAVSLVREDGTKASIWRDRVRTSELCAETERRLGLTVVDGRERDDLPGAGRDGVADHWLHAPHSLADPPLVSP